MLETLLMSMREIDEIFKYEKSDYKDIHLRLGYNSNEIELSKIIDFVKEEFIRVDDLLIAVYWIGFHLKQRDFIQYDLIERFQ